MFFLLVIYVIEIFYKKMNYNNQKIREQWAIEKSEKYKVKKERLEKIKRY